MTGDELLNRFHAVLNALQAGDHPAVVERLAELARLQHALAQAPAVTASWQSVRDDIAKALRQDADSLSLMAGRRSADSPPAAVLTEASGTAARTAAELEALGAALDAAPRAQQILGRVETALRSRRCGRWPAAPPPRRASLLEGPAAERTRMAQGDIRYPAMVLGHPAVTELLDFDRPVAVLFNAILHLLEDRQESEAIVGRFADALVPGSRLLITPPSAELLPPGQSEALYGSACMAPHPVFFRTHSQILRLFRVSTWSSRAWCTSANGAPTGPSRKNTAGPPCTAASASKDERRTFSG